MNTSTKRKSVAAVGLAMVIGSPIVDQANAATTKKTTTKTTTKSAAKTTTTSAATASKKDIDGTVASAGRWGSMQVRITVANKKIVSLSAPIVPESTPRSIEISNEAIPVFHREVLTAQSANIDGISRATDTWQAYVTSVQSAIDTAKAQGLL